MMIEKIAAHIADFTPRLQSNTRATYQVLTVQPITARAIDGCDMYVTVSLHV